MKLQDPDKNKNEASLEDILIEGDLEYGEKIEESDFEDTSVKKRHIKIFGNKKIIIAISLLVAVIMILSMAIVVIVNESTISSNRLRAINSISEYNQSASDLYLVVSQPENISALKNINKNKRGEHDKSNAAIEAAVNVSQKIASEKFVDLSIDFSSEEASNNVVYYYLLCDTVDFIPSVRKTEIGKSCTNLTERAKRMMTLVSKYNDSLDSWRYDLSLRGKEPLPNVCKRDCS